MTSDADLLKMATCFQVDDDLFIEARGDDAWAVTYLGRSVVNRALEREFEPIPPDRSEAFKARTRFSLLEAVDVAQRFLTKLNGQHAQA
ncbi:hypothetical protein [Salipiger mucosus]|uniref:Uncharacterized protein n=1 Tax=Salipiger mucosus DSM 16094 TaxID=1123237 RepID=S9RFA6_9RHOB|nr:hypothetical protein [Salipiger mucosus]EPX76795.1 hypothetical protein Salmuc_04681 [Salipiger mucosus DSM 16094]